MLQDKLQEDLKQAQLDREEVKVSTLRLLLSEVKNAEIQKGGPLSDEDLITVIQREIKKRKEAAAGFRSGGREESARKEEKEAAILTAYLPQQLSTEELTNIIEESITELEAKGLINEAGATGVQNMGKVIGLVMGKVKGRADGGTVSGLVKAKLL